MTSLRRQFVQSSNLIVTIRNIITQVILGGFHAWFANPVIDKCELNSLVLIQEF